MFPRYYGIEITDVLFIYNFFYVIDLLDAARSNQLDKIKKLLTKHNVNACDEEGTSLLAWASSYGNRKICELL